MIEWAALAKSFPGWSLEELRLLSPRERLNWLEIAREVQGIVRK